MKEKKRSFSVDDVVFNTLVGVCDVINVYEVGGKRRLDVQDTSGNKYYNIRPRDVIKCDEVFVPECIYIYGITQYRFTEDTRVIRSVDADYITNYVGLTDFRTPDNLAYVGLYLSKQPEDASGTIHELVANGTLVPKRARILQLQIQRLSE